MTRWDHKSADLLRAGRTAMTPTAADRERVRARLALSLGAGAAAATGTALASASAVGAAGITIAKPAKAAAFSLIVKGAVPLLFLVGLLALSLHLMQPSAPTAAPKPSVTASEATAAAAPVRPSDVVATPPVEPLPSVSSLPNAPSAAPVGAVAARAPARAAAAQEPKASPSEQPLGEARLVANIDAALREGDTERALRLVDEHAAQFPNGVLVEEREGARAIARCMRGSRSSGDAFLTAHPRSPMRNRVELACGSESEP